MVHVTSLLHQGAAVFGIMVGITSIGFIVEAIVTGKLRTERMPGV